MKHKELIESGALTLEIQSYLADSGLVTVALSLSHTMRDLAKELLLELYLFRKAAFDRKAFQSTEL